MKTLKFSMVVIFASAWMAAPAHAYLDPGTGSMILQALIGAVTGLFVIGGVYWAKIKAFFSRSRPED